MNTVKRILLEEKSELEKIERETYLGVDLFCTYETGKRPLNIRRLDDFIRKALI